MRTSACGGRIITAAITDRITGACDRDRAPLTGAQPGHVGAQVLAREREVARLLGDVDAHDALEQRVQLAPDRSAVRCTWSIGSSPPSTNTKNSAGNRRADARSTRRAPSLMSHVRPGTSRPAAVDELLEHQRVLRLLDDLVVHVAELGAAVGQAVRVLEQAALQHALELQAGLHVRGDAVQADPRPHLGAAGSGTSRSRRAGVGGELPARVGRIDAVARGRPTATSAYASKCFTTDCCDRRSTSSVNRSARCSSSSVDGVVMPRLRKGRGSTER